MFIWKIYLCACSGAAWLFSTSKAKCILLFIYSICKPTLIVWFHAHTIYMPAFAFAAPTRMCTKYICMYVLVCGYKVTCRIPLSNILLACASFNCGHTTFIHIKVLLNPTAVIGCVRLLVANACYSCISFYQNVWQGVNN